MAERFVKAPSLEFKEMPVKLAPMSSLVLALGLGATVACGAAPPLGYQGGVVWNLPLIAPLDGAELVVPVRIHGKGPFLFVLSPDHQVSLIDRDVAESLKLYTPADSWVGLIDHTDHIVRRRPYEVLDLTSGDLHLRHVKMYSAKGGSIQVRGIPVAGMLGSDLLTRTIVIDIDRDLGRVQLALTGHQKQPPNGTRIAGRIHHREGPIRKVVVPVSLERERTSSSLELAVDLASSQTKVWPKHLSRQHTPMRIGPERVEDVSLAEFDDRRVHPDDIDGVLGQDVLSKYRVVFDPDKRVLWLGPRSPGLNESAPKRIGRWGDVFSRCKALGCVQVRIDPDPVPVGTLYLERDPAAPGVPFDVVLQAVDKSGQPLPGLIRVRVEPTGGRPIVVRLARVDSDAVGYRVVDASPQSPPRRALSVNRTPGR